MEVEEIQGCRVCGMPTIETVFEFGRVPLADKFYPSGETQDFAPLSLYCCSNCHHLMIRENVSPVLLFKYDYPYLSGKIPEVKEHFKSLAEKVIQLYNIGPKDCIIELASNDGTLLENFLTVTKNLIGIEPSINPATIAISKGIKTITAFFNPDVAEMISNDKDFKYPAVIFAHNVLAHVPDPIAFVKGIRLLSDRNTHIIIEVPHALPMLLHNTFDVVFHQHYSYFSMHSIKKLFESNGLYLKEVEQINTQGGSLRLTLQIQPCELPVMVKNILNREVALGLTNMQLQKNFADQILRLKTECRNYLKNCIKKGKKVAAYGAPGKAAALLKYFELNADLIQFIVDVSPTKHGKFFTGTHIKIHPVQYLSENTPDVLLILSWNYKDTILENLKDLRQNGMTCVILYPDLTVYPPLD